MPEPEILAALRGICDPELGVGIVDLGLIYAAERTSDAVVVDMTTTVPSCPASDVLVEAVREALAQAFPGANIHVRLVFDPPWSPARVTDVGREQLGWGRKPAEAAEPAPAGALGRWARSLTRH